MVACVLLALVLACIAYVGIKLISYTPPIKGDNAIASLETVTIGNVKQSILIRSTNTNNPILLYLHSGPGSTEMVPFRTYNPDLEKNFTVVIWEQRGTGKSYSPTLPQATMTISRLVADTGELMEYLLNRFHQQKLFLVGHSWGTALGLLAAQRFPQYVYAYAGSGQEVAPAEGEKLSYEYTLGRAKQAGDANAVRELTQINKNNSYLSVDNNPDWYTDLKTERKWLVKYGGEAYGKDNCSFFIFPALGLSEYTIPDFIGFAKGSELSLKELWPEVMKLDFRKTAKEIGVPVFFLQGRHDENTPSSLVQEYFDMLSAPTKKLIWFDASGHHPMYEQAAVYDQTLISALLPIAKK